MHGIINSHYWVVECLEKFEEFKIFNGNISSNYFFLCGMENVEHCLKAFQSTPFRVSHRIERMKVIHFALMNFIQYRIHVKIDR